MSKTKGLTVLSKLVEIFDLIYTLWLFTESDFFTFVLPNTMFGIFGALSGLGSSTHSKSHIPIMQLLIRIPSIVAFNWSNLLIFDIANQRLPAAVVEDSVNKPWRPLPTRKITMSAAQAWLLMIIPTTLTIANIQKVGFESAILVTLTWMYNDLGGGDCDYRVRNAIIAAAFAVYNTASLKIALGAETISMISIPGQQWILVVSGVILTTMHIQDLKDIEGDRRRCRRTAPLVLGNDLTRWTIVAGLLFWSLFCPWFWQSSWIGVVQSSGTGALVAFRILKRKDPAADRLSWKIWAWWTVSLYFLPLLQPKP